MNRTASSLRPVSKASAQTNRFAGKRAFFQLLQILHSNPPFQSILRKAKLSENLPKETLFLTNGE